MSDQLCCEVAVLNEAIDRIYRAGLREEDSNGAIEIQDFHRLCLQHPSAAVECAKRIAELCQHQFVGVRIRAVDIAGSLLPRCFDELGPALLYCLQDAEIEPLLSAADHIRHIPIECAQEWLSQCIPDRHRRGCDSPALDALVRRAVCERDSDAEAMVAACGATVAVRNALLTHDWSEVVYCAALTAIFFTTKDIVKRDALVDSLRRWDSEWKRLPEELKGIENGNDCVPRPEHLDRFMLDWVQSGTHDLGDLTRHWTDEELHHGKAEVVRLHAMS